MRCANGVASVCLQTLPFHAHHTALSCYTTQHRSSRECKSEFAVLTDRGHHYLHRRRRGYAVTHVRHRTRTWPSRIYVCIAIRHHGGCTRGMGRARTAHLTRHCVCIDDSRQGIAGTTGYADQWQQRHRPVIALELPTIFFPHSVIAAKPLGNPSAFQGARRSGIHLGAGLGMGALR